MKKVPDPGPFRMRISKQWKQSEDGVIICSGTIGLMHKKLKGRGEQGASICVVACVLADWKMMTSWGTATLDEIVELGSQLHAKSRMLHKNKSIPLLNPSNVHRYFFLDQFQVRVKVKKVAMKGKTALLNEDVVSKFFERYANGIVAFNTAFFSLWKIDMFFYLFDPQEHHSNGEKWTGTFTQGVCCLKRFNDLKKLTATLLDNVNFKENKIFKIYPCSLDKLIKINTKPPETLDLELSKKLSLNSETTRRQDSSDCFLKKSPPFPEVKEEKVISIKLKPKKFIVPDSGTNFIVFDKGKRGILRTFTHQNDPTFTKYQGTQSFSNAIAALVMRKVLKSMYWVKVTLHHILKLGDKIHQDTLRLPPDQKLPLVSLNDEMFIVEVNKEAVAIGSLVSGLEEVLDNYFFDCECGILIGPYVVGVWKEAELYYMFDPNERNGVGGMLEEVGEKGVACVTWFKEVKDLVSLYLNNVGSDKWEERFVLCQVIIKDCQSKSG